MERILKDIEGVRSRPINCEDDKTLLVSYFEFQTRLGRYDVGLTSMSEALHLGYIDEADPKERYALLYLQLSKLDDDLRAYLDEVELWMADGWEPVGANKYQLAVTYQAAQRPDEARPYALEYLETRREYQTWLWTSKLEKLFPLLTPEEQQEWLGVAYEARYQTSLTVENDYHPTTPQERRDVLDMMVRGPIAHFPDEAIDLRVEGTCDTQFDVNLFGRAINIEPNCSHPVFEESAIRAIARVEFWPYKEEGRFAERKGVVFPFTYSLN